MLVCIVIAAVVGLLVASVAFGWEGSIGGTAGFMPVPRLAFDGGNGDGAISFNHNDCYPFSIDHATEVRGDVLARDFRTTDGRSLTKETVGLWQARGKDAERVGAVEARVEALEKRGRWEIEHFVMAILALSILLMALRLRVGPEDVKAAAWWAWKTWQQRGGR
jgi:hypothetical protein